MKFFIQYVSRRAFQHGVDPEDQAWRIAAGETIEGTEAEADARATELDAETDHEFIHRAVAALEEAS